VKKLDSNSSAAGRESCTEQTKTKNPFGSLNIEIIVKMCTWKIAENTSLANRLNKHVNRPHITVKTIQGPTSTWLFDTGADVTVMAMREFRKIPIEKRPITKPPTMKTSSASSDSLKIVGVYKMPTQ
jgi:hypothetical protein